MPVTLDFVVFVAVFVLTLIFLAANYVVYLSRGNRNLAAYTAVTLVGGGTLIAVFIGSAMIGLGEQYGSAAILSRWGFTFGWAFLLSLGGSGAAVLERRSEGRISITLTIVATLLLGFALVSGLVFSEQSLPPLPASLANLALAALLTSIFKWMLERRRKKKGFFARLADLFRG